jgi:predicted CDP-diglyceride synthetase/phosphatidate cytidylyltransferase
MTAMFLFGVILLAVGLFQMLTMPAGAPGNISDYAIATGFVMMILAGARMLQGESHYMQDERTKRIGAWGLSYSWFLTFMAMFAVFWLDYLEIASPDAGTLSVVFILLMGISARVFQIYLFRKGDVG